MYGSWDGGCNDEHVGAGFWIDALINNKSGNVRWERLATGVVPLPSGCISTDAELAGATL